MNTMTGRTRKAHAKEAPKDKKVSLYEIAEELKKLDNLFEETGGVIPEGDAGKAIVEALEKYEWLAEEKVDNYGRYYITLKADAKMFKEEMDRLAKRRQVIANKIERLKGAADAAMTTLKRERLPGKLFTIAKQGSGGERPVEILDPYIENPDKLPEEFQKKTVAADKEKIREALEKNPTGPVASVARLGNRGYFISIR